MDILGAMRGFGTNPRPKALVVANLHKAEAGTASGELRATLDGRGWDTEVFGFDGDPANLPDLEGFNLVVSLGGDGTLLFIARKAAPFDIPLLPINLGTLGFIAANRRDSWESVFDDWLSGALEPSRRILIAVSVIRDEKQLGSFIALNDAVVSSQGIAKMIRLQLDVNGDTFGHYRADGLIVATPTGSTAYNLAAGGPALYPEMPAFVINPICPFTVASRPLVLPSSQRVDVWVDETRRSGALLTIDGQETLELRQGDLIHFRRCAHDALLIVPPENIFFQALRTKLGWSGDGHA